MRPLFDVPSPEPPCQTIKPEGNASCEPGFTVGGEAQVVGVEKVTGVEVSIVIVNYIALRLLDRMVNCLAAGAS